MLKIKKYLIYFQVKILYNIIKKISVCIRLNLKNLKYNIEKQH